jgi:dipeptidyl aminopeptidase/acylaminoacyl peptidase
METDSEGEDPLVRASDYRELTQVGEPRVHPDGDRVAFVRTDPVGDDEYESTVYLADLESDPAGSGGASGGEGVEVRQFTVAEGRDSQPRFSPSGDRLAFVSTRGADDDRPQLWVLPTRGGEARQVTDVAGGVGSISWSPAGDRIAFTQRVTAEAREQERDLAVPEEYEPREPDPRVIDRTVYRSMQQYFDGERGHVYLADPDEGGVERVTEWAERDYAGVDFGDAATLYYAAAPEDVADPDDTTEFVVYAHDLDADEREVIVRSSGWAQSLSATPEGRVAYPYTPEDQAALRQTDLRVYDRDSGEEYTPTAELDRTLGYGAAPEWGPENERLYFATPDEGSVLLRRVRWDDTDVETVAGEGKAVSGAAPGPDGVVAFTASEADHRGDVFAVAGGETRRLTEVNADYFAGKTLAEPEELGIEGPDGEIQGWLLLPPGAAIEERGDDGDAHPLVVEIHGGPHAMWTTSGTVFHEFQTLAARGYAVFWSNPRGSTGYGEAFAAAIERDWGRVTLEDVEAGVDHVLERPEIDGEELYVTGGSFGGYMTAWTVGQTDRFEAAVSQRGVYDFTGFYGSTDAAYSLVEDDYDTLPWEEPQFLHEQSPVAHADGVDTPTLLIHSDRDFRTPANTAELFHRYLRKGGVDTRLVRYPREGHELSRSGEPAHVVDRIERIARWFDGYSEYFEAERALDRDRDDGLSAGEADDEDGADDGTSADAGGGEDSADDE